MNELIAINLNSIDGQQTQTVNARDLHAFLEVKTAFKDWIQRRISDFGFEEGKDFCSILSESSGGRPTKEYHISLDMAKELSMVERNEKGRQARQYFIRCEKALRTTVSIIKSVEENKVGAYFAIARHMVALANVSPERATATALTAIHEATGLTTEPYRAMLPAVEPKDQAHMNATAVGKELGMRAVEVNLKLSELGLIEKDPSGKGWKLTDKGAEYGEARPYVNHGHAGFDIKWRKSVLGLLKQGAAA